VPSDLYRFLDNDSGAVTLTVDGEKVPIALDNGYVTLMRTWKEGDVIELNLPMSVRRVIAHTSVEADRGRVALQRGPIVYAAEWPDNPNGKVRNIVLPDSSRLTTAFRADVLNGVQVIAGRAFGLSENAKGAVERTEQPFLAVPYATWANRGRGQMTVWLARADAAARPVAYPTIATTSTITVSPVPSGRGKNPRYINDGEAPLSSADSTAYFDWWPVQGWSPACDAPAGGQPRRPCSRMEWVEMAFAEPATVSATEVYWFDDTGRGGVRVPASWRLLYKDGEQWKPVGAAGRFGVERDRWNSVTFAPVTTDALRIELAMQPEFSAGIQEWNVGHARPRVPPRQ
jgi:hypothetical protein